MLLRPYQTAAIDRARRLLHLGKRRILLCAPTGAGKTVIATEGLIRPALSRGKRVLFIAHRAELLTQCADKLRQTDELPLPISLIKAGYKADYDCLFQVASIQTLVRRQLPFADLVIWDEAHHATADSYQRVQAAYPEAVHVGLTATPYRAGGQGLGGCFDSLVEVATIPELIRDGFLVRPRCFALPGPDLSGVRIVAGDYNEGQLAEVMDKPRIGTRLVETYQRHALGRSAIAFAVNVAHSKHIVEQFTAAGITAEHLDGGTDPELRAAILVRLASGETQVVSNCGVLTEGFDCPRVSCIILARPTKSRCMWRQCVGRGLRPYEGKVDCQIHDHAGARAFHGEIDDAEELSLNGVRPRPGSSGQSVRQCMACFAIAPATHAVCPECNSPYPKPKPVERETVDEELSEATERAVPRDGQPLTAVERRCFFVLVNMAAERGWKSGAVSYRFKEKFGRWPASREVVEKSVTDRRDELARAAAMMKHAQAENRTATLAELETLYNVH